MSARGSATLGGWRNAEEVIRSDDDAFDRLTPDRDVARGYLALAVAILDPNGSATSARVRTSERRTGRRQSL